MNKEVSKKILIYAGIVLFFAVLAYGFTPQVLGGKIVNQSDISAWRGMSHEATSFNAEHPDDPTYWTNSMFGGMPTTATIDDFEGDATKPMYKLLLVGKRPASYLFVTLLGAFLLMLSMGINGIVAVAGAVAVAFCSYNMQIIQVGHNTKMQAIAFFPWVLAGVIYTYRSALTIFKENTWKKWLPKTVLGSVLFAFALSFQIKANHPQITYYLAIVIFIYAISVFINLCINKDKRSYLKQFFIASALLLFVGCVGIATNANKLIPTYEYSEYTMRGGSELKGSGDGHNDRGLDLEYATAWSYGIEEMPNLMIPNFNGGASSGALDMDSETAKLLKRAGQPNLRETIKHLPLYWGPQPFTAGPMYIGAISIFLFVLGVCLCKGREKWWMLIATIFAIFLAWGNHFMWFTKLMFEYAPMYNKFRTVSMALTVLQVTVPLLGFYVLDKIIKEEYTKKEFSKAALIAYVLTGGFCLLCRVFPGIAGSFVGAGDAGMQDILVDALAADRASIMAKDAMRSFSLITIAAALIFWAYQTPKRDAVGPEGSFVRKGRMSIVAATMIILVCIDLFPVGKRYLNKDHFVTQKDFTGQFNPRPVDELILMDEDPNYRVLDISVNTFNDAHPSYHHKCIGGYSPVKLQRYQDLIERYISREISSVRSKMRGVETIQELEENLPFLKVVSALNGKYIIIGDEFAPVVNHRAMGNCWFVDSLVTATTPDDEINLIALTDLATTAIIGDDFEWAQKAFPAADSTANDSIVLTSYAPNELRYTYDSASDRAAVFSEIYYPEGWKAWVDGQEIDLFRADWMLRGAILPAGAHELVMRFEPQSYAVGKNISTASSITLIVLMLLAAAGMIVFNKKD